MPLSVLSARKVKSMKSSIIVCQLDSGVLHSAVLPTFAEANDALARIRKDKTVEIGKKSVGVVQAIVVSQNGSSAQVVKTANIAADARREAMIAKVAKAAKAKNEDK